MDTTNRTIKVANSDSEKMFGNIEQGSDKHGRASDAYGFHGTGVNKNDILINLPNMIQLRAFQIPSCGIENLLRRRL